MTERRYDDDEVALILHRAVEATTTSPERAPGMGLTLAELKEIGAEAGISRTGIEMAARTLEVREDPPATGAVLGLPTTVQLERVVPVRLDDEHLPQLLDLIRSEFARQGSWKRSLADSNGVPEAGPAGATYPSGAKANRRASGCSATTATACWRAHSGSGRS